MTAPHAPTPVAADGLDRLAVVGLEARGFHGVFDAERREGQVFRVDLTLGLDTTEAAASDDPAGEDDADHVLIGAGTRAD